MQTKRLLNDVRQDVSFVGPGLFFFVLFVALAFAMSVYYSFTDWNIVSGDAPWVGFENYRRVLDDPRVLKSASFTARFAVVTTILSNVLGLALALLVTQPIVFKRMYRVIFFIPNVIGGVILGYVFRFIFSTAFGAIGDATGIGFFSFAWLGTPTTGFWATVIVFVWKSSGYLMVIYVAAIVSIDESLLESAKIDGANWYQATRRITLPLIAPAVTIGIFLMLAISSKLFDVNFALTNGGPYGSTEAFALNVYNEAFVYNNQGTASAKAVIFFVVVGFVTLVQVGISKRREVEM
jgi:raffinose/stachyose/melibiose transport system permease protein